MMSSSAASGISVFVTGPFVWYSFTIESAGAGAVANAIPPKMKPSQYGMCAMANTIQKVALTTRNVPID